MKAINDMDKDKYRALTSEIIGTEAAPIRPHEAFGQAYDRILEELTKSGGVITKSLIQQGPSKKKKASKPKAQLLWFRCNSGFEQYGTDREKLRRIGDLRVNQGLSNGYSISPVDEVTEV